ncbi:MAG: esterase-like activity of phytase family protein, partial [Opitutaceae bacterium]|nr:esterase-like activity of phytase family protein [Opitutaceae bacterium]
STAHNDEIGIDLLGNTLAVDPFGGDFEGIVVDPTDGSFWMCDEYRPAIYHFNSSGILIDRFVPIGTAAAAGQVAGYYGTEVLPAVIAQRRQNRGFEGIALHAGKIYAFVQSPARNPVSASNGALNALQNVRLVEMNTTTFATRQFIYTLDNAALGGEPNTRADKIGDMVSMGNGDFLAVERDDDSTRDGDAAGIIEKKIYRFNLTFATDVSSMSGLIGATGKTVDQLTVAEMLANSITPVLKTLQVDLTAAGYSNVQKVEGLALVDPFTLAVINDNDFQVAGITINNTTGTFTRNVGYNPEPIVLGLVDMQSNSLDASDRDNVINIRPWPVKGMYLPDTISSFKVRNRTYLITANEGDSRDYAGFSEETRVKDITLDPVAFPLWATLRRDSNLGRLKITKTLGKTLDNKYSELYSFGGRSFTIWNDAGVQVFDSGDLIEQIIAADPVYGAIFNAGHTNITRDDRSDDKGPEPEALAVGTINGSVYAFIGLERVGGFVTFDVTDPAAPRFLGYMNNRNPAITPALGVGGDVGPEGLLFIEAKASPTRKPMLAITNEVSSTVTLYNIDVVRGQ